MFLLREAVGKPAGAGSSRGSLLREIEYMAVTLDLPQGFLAFQYHRITWETPAHGKAFLLFGIWLDFGLRGSSEPKPTLAGMVRK